MLDRSLIRQLDNNMKLWLSWFIWYRKTQVQNIIFTINKNKTVYFQASLLVYRLVHAPVITAQNARKLGSTPRQRDSFYWIFCTRRFPFSFEFEQRTFAYFRKLSSHSLCNCKLVTSFYEIGSTNSSGRWTFINTRSFQISQTRWVDYLLCYQD